MSVKTIKRAGAVGTQPICLHLSPLPLRARPRQLRASARISRNVRSVRLSAMRVRSTEVQQLDCFADQAQVAPQCPPQDPLLAQMLESQQQLQAQLTHLMAPSTAAAGAIE